MHCQRHIPEIAWPAGRITQRLCWETNSEATGATSGFTLIENGGSRDQTAGHVTNQVSLPYSVNSVAEIQTKIAESWVHLGRKKTTSHELNFASIANWFLSRSVRRSVALLCCQLAK